MGLESLPSGSSRLTPETEAPEIDKEASDVRPWQGLVVLALILLVLDAIAKLWLTGAIEAFSRDLAGHWRVTALLQASGAAILGTAAWHAFGFRRTDLIPAAIVIGVTLATVPLMNHSADLSYDGMWYHLQRVLMFPNEWPISGLTFDENGPALVYPLLIDNLRGLTVSIAGTGPFSGIAVNFGLTAASLYAWQRGAWFIPRPLRWIPAIGPIAAQQMFTQYADGAIAQIGGMAFLAGLTSIRLRGFAQSTITVPQATAIRGLLIAICSAALAMQLKYSFPLLLLTFGLPGLLAALLHWRTIGALLTDRKTVGLSLLACTAGALAVANPYFLVIHSTLSRTTYSYFTLANLQYFSRQLIQAQVDPLFPRSMWEVGRFLSANLFAVWPGQTADLITPGTTGLMPTIREFVARLAMPDSRFSGFGPFAAAILIFALAVSGVRMAALAKARRSGEPWRPDLAPALAVIFLGEFALSLILPMSWWARLNPAVFLAATCLLLARLKSGAENEPARITAGRSISGHRILRHALIATTALQVAIPPAAWAMRHRLKVAQIREMNTAFADQIAASPMRTLHVPNQCPASFDSSVQTGLLVNFVQIFSDRNLAIARRDPKSCNLAGFDIFPKQQVCYCKQ